MGACATLRMRSKKRGSSFDLVDPWLLLRETVNGAHAPHEWFAVDGDHAAVGKDALEGFGGARVIGVTEHGKQHDVVGDVEICVTRR